MHPLIRGGAVRASEAIGTAGEIKIGAAAIYQGQSPERSKEPANPMSGEQLFHLDGHAKADVFKRCPSDYNGHRYHYVTVKPIRKGIEPFVPTFQQAGFSEVGRAGTRRHIFQLKVV